MNSYRRKLYDSYFSTHASHLYGESSIEKIRIQFPVWESYFARFLPMDKSVMMIDIGCGSGGFVYWLNGLGYEGASGIDRSPEQIEIANSLGIKNVKQADLRELLDDQENVYEVIFARDVMEHLLKEEVLDILQIFHKALKPGGVIVIQTPNGESPFSGRLRYGDFTHEVIFTRSSLNQVLRATGYKDVACYPTGPVPKGLKSIVRYLMWKIIEIVLLSYTLIETGSKDAIFTQNIIARAQK